MTSNQSISVNNNIGRLTEDTVFSNNADTNNDIIVLRDTLTNGLQKEYFGDYMFLGYSNLDILG